MLATFKKLFAARPDLLPKKIFSYDIEWLKPCDIRQIARLELISFPEPLGFWELLWLWLMPATTYITVKKERQVVAYIGFQIHGHAAHTISMCVHPHFRRMGLGMIVQQTADNIAGKLGARWFTGEVRVSNTAQLKMLEELGWQTIGECRSFFNNGEDCFVVWNWLYQEQENR